MTTLPEMRVIHSYDTEAHRVRCGVVELSNSTKHARGVTCVTCRGLLDRSRAEVALRADAGVGPFGA